MTTCHIHITPATTVMNKILGGNCLSIVPSQLHRWVYLYNITLISNDFLDCLPQKYKILFNFYEEILT